MTRPSDTATALQCKSIASLFQWLLASSLLNFGSLRLIDHGEQRISVDFSCATCLEHGDSAHFCVIRRPPGAPRPSGPSRDGSRGKQLRQPHQVARRHRELEQGLDPRQSTLFHLAHPGRGLEPAEVRLDPGTRLQAQRVTRMPRRAAIDRAAPTAVVLRHVRRHPGRATGRHEVRRVVGLVRRQRASSPAVQLLQQPQCGFAFAVAVRLTHAGPAYPKFRS